MCTGRWRMRGFNTQPPEGGWPDDMRIAFLGVVSTHSRLKAAGRADRSIVLLNLVSTHSRLKAAGIPNV